MSIKSRIRIYIYEHSDALTHRMNGLRRVKMKKFKQMLLLFLLVFLSFNVYGGFWIKAIWVADGQLIYDGKNGYFFLNGWHNNIFDISSKVYLRGFFHSIGSSYDMPLKKSIRLNDATFFSFGERYELDEIVQKAGNC